MESRQEFPTVPNFEIVRRIGAGGFSTVYEAVDTHVNGRVALKVLRVDLSDDRGRERFEREGRTMGRLRDVSGIVSVYRTTYTTDGRPVIVMAYCPNGSLADRLRSDGPLDVDRVETLGTEVASALAAAHAHGIFHRDIKPENILETQSGHYALSDFGIAAVDGYRGSTETASTLTPPHAPPERFTDVDGQEQSGAAGDIYSLGSTLHMLLTGRPPFGTARDGGIAALAQRVMNDPPAPIEREGVSPGLVTAIAKALAKDPRDRYADAQAFADALKAADTESHPIDALIAGAVPPPEIDLTERPTKSAVPASAGAVSGTPDSIVDAPLVPAKELLKGPVRSGSKSRRPWIAVGVVAVCAALVGALLVAQSDDESKAGTKVAGVSSIKYPLEDQGAVSAQRVWQFASGDGTELDGSLTANRITGEDPRGAALVEFVPTELAKNVDTIRWSVKPSKTDVVSGSSGSPGKGVGSTPSGTVVRFALADSQTSMKVTYRVTLPKGTADAVRLNRLNVAREAFKVAACRAATNSCGSIPVPESLAFWPSTPVIGVGQVVAANPLLFETNTDKSVVTPGTVTGSTWSVTEPSIASVDANGQVTGIGEGFAHVQATIEGLAPAEIIVAVTKDQVPVVAKLKVTGPGKVVDGRSDGRPAKYSANPVDKDGRAVPGVVVAWTVSPSDVGTVDVQGAFASLLPPGQTARVAIGASVVNAKGDRVADSMAVTVSATDNPPPDRDRDGIPDAQDSCPDTFGLAQFGGCPDSDSDGTPEPQDACPGVHGLTAFNGCPDADGDGIPEPPDACPTQAAPGTANGCPNPDADGDGIPIPTDKCPDQREPRTADGCFRADLIVTRIFWDGTPVANDCVVFHVEIKNIGSAPSPNVKHGILLYRDGQRSDMPWSDNYRTGLAVNETRIQTMNSGRGDATCAADGSQWRALGGSHTIEAWVDDHEGVAGEGFVNEISGDNNRKTQVITVG